MTTNLLDGKIVLITGAAGALGRVIVRTLTENGAAVVANDVLERSAVLDVLGAAGADLDRVHYYRADMTDEKQIDQLFTDLVAEVGVPTTVCCHAGIVEDAALPDIPIDSFDRVMGINVRANFLTAQAAARMWKEQDATGHLLFTTSWVEDVPWPGIATYNASKAALRSLMRGFARELAPRIRANAVAPGIVGVGMAKNQWDTDPEYRSRAAKAIPLGEMQPPESVANAFLFLCSDLSTSMTGSVLLVDGGCSLYPMD